MTAEARRHSADPICVRVPEATRLTGISRPRPYELMKSGDIALVKVDCATPIPYESLSAFIERCRGGDPRQQG